MQRINARTLGLTGLALTAALAMGCSTYKEGQGTNNATATTHRQYKGDDASASVNEFKRVDPELDRFFNTAAGYAVFPEVTQGGAGIGAAHGQGVVYQNGQTIGYTEVTSGSIGLQLGGQTFREIIFFRDQATLDNFKQGNLEFNAKASAVAASKGASANADYANGVAVFTMPKGGLMFDASIGGQKFEYWSK